MYNSKLDMVTTTKFDIDLRSDTATRPTPEMFDAMRIAPTGDDVFGEDPTVLKLEKTVADLLGKESAAFVASGTMGNLLSIMAHCWGRGYDIVCGDKSHIFQYEQGGVSAIAGVLVKTVPNKPDGTMDVKDIENAVGDGVDCHKSKTQMICLENTHNVCGGVIISADYCWEVNKIANKHGIPLHLDGARILNAAASLGVDPKVLAEPFDTINMCLSKALGAPVGSVICGPPEFIQRAKRLRKFVGGGWRQAGILAACGLVSIDDYKKKFSGDHENALFFAMTINSIPGIRVDLASVHTNLVYFFVEPPSKYTAAQLVEKLEDPKSTEASVTIGVFAVTPTSIRAAFHYQVSRKQTVMFVDKLKALLK